MTVPKDPILANLWYERQRKARIGKHYSSATEFKKGQISNRKGIGQDIKSIMRRFNQGYIIAKNGCWDWQGYVDKTGYAGFLVNHKRLLVHRFSYEIFNGHIPNGITVDHICKNRKCVNPWHLDLTTRFENVQRGANKIAQNAGKLNCPQGHSYSGENLYVTKKGFRQCKTCQKIRYRKNQSKKESQTKC